MEEFPFGNSQEIKNLVGKYWDSITNTEEHSEKNVFPVIVGRARAQGYLLKDDLIEFGRWKSKERNVHHYKKNSLAFVVTTTRKALVAKTREEALRHLEGLDGVALPTASAILHWFRDDTPIIDFRVVEALGYNMTSKELISRLNRKDKGADIDKLEVIICLPISAGPSRDCLWGDN